MYFMLNYIGVMKLDIFIKIFKNSNIVKISNEFKFVINYY